MDNIINFPSHIVEKEKELARIQFDLEYDRMLHQREINKIKRDKVRRRSDLMLSSSTGMIVMGTLLMLMYA